MNGFIVYPTYVTENNETFIHLYGRLENGQSFLTINKFSPYLYIKKTDAKKISDNWKTENTNLKNFRGEEVAKISFKNRTDLNLFQKDFHKEIETYESDI